MATSLETNAMVVTMIHCTLLSSTSLFISVAVLLTPTYSPRSGSSVDPAGTYSVDVSNNADLDVSNNADSTASVVEPHGFVDKTSADVSGEVTEKEKIEVVVPTIEVTEVQEVEPSSDEMKHDDITAIEAANELKAANLSEAAMKKGELVRIAQVMSAVFFETSSLKY